MFRNNEIKKLVIIEIIIILIVLLISIIFFNITFNQYKKEVVRNNSYIITNIIDKHPELELEVINLIRKGTHNVDNQILSKYGLDDLNNLEYLNNITTLKRELFSYNILYLIIVVLIVIVINVLFIKKTYKKISQIDVYMNNVLNNNYTLDIVDYNEGDISNLKNDIYKMTIRLKKQAIDLQKEKNYLEEVLSDISHQMKTPLTSMYVINDILDNTNIKPKVKKEMLSKNKNQLERMEWLISSLLKLSRLDSDKTVLKKEQVKIIELIDNALSPLKISIELKNIKLDINISKNLTLLVDNNWTLEAIGNVIKNAYEHTNENGKITISAEDNPLYVSITIKDNGTGISKEDLPHIFERFYKTNTKVDSIGIGLNMSKKIISMQNGDIEVVSKVNEGTTFIVKFYKNVI